MNDTPERIEVLVNLNDCPRDGRASEFVIAELRKAGVPMCEGSGIGITSGTLTRSFDFESLHPNKMQFVWTAK